MNYYDGEWEGIIAYLKTPVTQPDPAPSDIGETVLRKCR
jgi:hypothetical protein